MKVRDKYIKVETHNHANNLRDIIAWEKSVLIYQLEINTYLLNIETYNHANNNLRDIVDWEESVLLSQLSLPRSIVILTNPSKHQQGARHVSKTLLDRHQLLSILHRKKERRTK